MFGSECRFVACACFRFQALGGQREKSKMVGVYKNTHSPKATICTGTSVCVRATVFACAQQFEYGFAAAATAAAAPEKVPS